MVLLGLLTFLIWNNKWKRFIQLSRYNSNILEDVAYYNETALNLGNQES